MSSSLAVDEFDEVIVHGEVEWMEVARDSKGESSVALLERLRRKHGGRPNVIWDNAPAHRGPAMRSYLETPDLNFGLVHLPGYSPDFNADEEVRGWAREEATGNQCLVGRAVVREQGQQLPHWTCQLQSRGDVPLPDRLAI